MTPPTRPGVLQRPDGTRAFAPGNQLGEKFSAANDAALTHGGYSDRAIAPVADEIERAIEQMVAGTPAALPQFAGARHTLALKLARLARVRGWIDEQRGGMPLDDDGNPLPAAKLEADLLSSIESSLANLGLTPTSAARLGVDLAQGESLVERLQREARERDGKA